eukprot:11970185-Alexandrium_andersonii.AAC.1
MGLKFCKKAWAAIASAETLAMGSGVVKSLLDAVVWVDFLSVRGILVSLAEWDFQFVPPPEQ